MRSKANTLPEGLPKTFSELCRLHLPRPINDSIDYENTAQVVDRLATLAKLSNEQEEYLETLTILIEKYDRDTFSESAESDPIGRLKRLMANREMTASDLGRVLGNRSLGPAILRGDRTISKANAVKLGTFFKMSPTAFFQP
jgi:HTH-type transcriptional regulator/antitoxin HigA